MLLIHKKILADLKPINRFRFFLICYWLKMTEWLDDFTVWLNVFMDWLAIRSQNGGKIGRAHV